MNLPNYPCPCISCQLPCAENGSSNYHKCSGYRLWFLWWWKYYQHIFGIKHSRTDDQKSTNKFVYYHPDELKDLDRILKEKSKENILRTSAKKPCFRCSINEMCDRPCNAYLCWYDASLALIRKQIGREKC